VAASVVEEKTSALVVEEKASVLVAEEKTSVLVAEEKTSALVAEVVDKTASVLMDEVVKQMPPGTMTPPGTLAPLPPSPRWVTGLQCTPDGSAHTMYAQNVHFRQCIRYHQAVISVIWHSC
jgi:hypothetical protein